jgi:hypothetical protein
MKLSDLIKEADYNNPKYQEYKQTAPNIKTAAPTDHPKDKPTVNAKDDVTTTKVPDQIHKDSLNTESDVSPVAVALASGLVVRKIK